MLDERDRRALRNARRLALEEMKMRESLKELELRSIGTPVLSGMPGAGGVCDGVSRQIIRIEEAQRRLEAAARVLKDARRIAKRACRKCMPYPSMRVFCESYYVDAQTFEMACIASGVKERQCRRYMKKVERE